MRRALVVLAVALAARPSAGAGRPVVAVFDLENKRAKLSDGLLDDLSDYIATQLTESGVYVVVPRNQIQQALRDEKKATYGSCFDESCQIELGKELAAEKTLASQVARIGSKCIVTLKLFDLRAATAERAGSATGPCTEDGILASIQTAIAKVTKGAKAPAPVTVSDPPAIPSPPVDLGQLDRDMAAAKEAEAADLERRAVHSKTLARHWAKVQKYSSVDRISKGKRVAALEKFLATFPDDNPHAVEAQSMIDTLKTHPASVVWVASKPAGVKFSRSEVTVGQYRACVKAGRCKASAVDGREPTMNYGKADRDDHPVNAITWYGADTFCRWVGGRLPTDSEWFAEASDNNTRTYPWGMEAADCARAVKYVSGATKPNGCGQPTTGPVCSRAKGNSVSGLCDMGGSLWEWTAEKSLRGASWRGSYPAPSCGANNKITPSSHSYVTPDTKNHGFGFRCARN